MTTVCQGRACFWSSSRTRSQWQEENMLRTDCGKTLKDPLRRISKDTANSELPCKSQRSTDRGGQRREKGQERVSQVNPKNISQFCSGIAACPPPPFLSINLFSPYIIIGFSPSSSYSFMPLAHQGYKGGCFQGALRDILISLFPSIKQLYHIPGLSCI